MSQPPRQFGADFLTELFRFPLDPGYADAARARAASGPRPPARRVALRVMAAATAIVIGLLFAVAYRQTVADEPERARTRAGLVEAIQGLRTETDRQQQHAAALRADVSRLRDTQLGDQTVAELAALEAAASMVPVSGDAVVVTVADAPGTPDPVTGRATTEPLDRIIDSDLRKLVNALWAAGAEAIEVNGQRLTATSTIRAAGGPIQVDLKPIASPYRVAAIGPSRLRQAYLRTDAALLFRRLAAARGIGYRVRTVEDLRLSAAVDRELREARPLPSPTPTAGAGPRQSPSTDSPGGGR